LLEIVSGGEVVGRRQFELREGDFRSFVFDGGLEEPLNGSGP
jgi:hypothetical protein